MSVIDVFGLIGILLIIGFLADFLFKKTNFPDILILLAIGFVIGPVLKIIDPAQIAPFSQLIASLALVVIIFNAGIEFEFTRVLSSAPRTLILVLFGVAFSIAAIAAPAYYFFHWKLLDSILLGTIVGGTSSAIVMPLMSRARVPEQVSALLSLESVLNSPVVIVIALVLLKSIVAGEAGIALSSVGVDILTQFLLGLSVGVITGLLWLWILTLLQNEDYNDILTLAVVFLLYFAVEKINGSGVIFALVFGLILGNGVSVGKLLKLKRTAEATEIMKRFTAQIYFFIKTFFFIYLGLIITFGDPMLAALGIFMALTLLLVRFIAVLFTSIGNHTLLSNKGILTMMLARGESAAVLVQIVVAAGIANGSVYPDMIMAVIITTVVFSALGVLIFGKKTDEGEIESEPA
ncbi:MAG: cation:proton antiporter [Dehalococcoidia bacterium]|nr:cation:proton antiporter [Dehalococcoidia bacterium]MDD5493847.1 cation:proton antiporter [Dehalococcoidia bacterium]